MTMLKKCWQYAVVAVLCVSLFLAGCGEKETVRSVEDPSMYAPETTLTLSSEYYYLEDLDTASVLLDQGSTERMFPASLTKMMTAIVALEQIEDPSSVTIEITRTTLKGLIEASANRAGYWYGDTPTALDLIYGVLLPSGADCCRALALYVSGSEEAFVDLMNQKAQELGMLDTHFVNTTGLHDDNHYSTCRDLAKLLKYCMQNETFMEVIHTRKYVSTPVKTYPDGLSMDNYVLFYLDEYDPAWDTHFSIPGFIGGKGGYTIEARHCLASLCDAGSLHLLLINAHAYKDPYYYPAAIEDAAVIYNYFGAHYAYEEPIIAGSTVASIKVRNGDVTQVDAVAADTVAGILPSDSNLHVYVDVPEVIDAPVSEGTVIGKVQIYAYDRLYAESDLYLDTTVTKTFAGSVRTLLQEKGGALALLAGVAVMLLVLVRKSRRRK
ncbi:hypothetical protein [Galactobacillus timonensis]|uniref:D-alanyl-D-alanine carboxypeptidase family protein n=1 Tax=Galactobacillus timonensis TaxID=2041840 RepID=UPI00240A4844|nr:hypothetical protein [Galactobacillus timonensis]MDD6679876.1 hypothetical protein [Galactobacillus timonensis]